MRISLKHKFGTFPVNCLIRDVTYIGNGAYLILRKLTWSKNTLIIVKILVLTTLNLFIKISFKREETIV